MRRITITTLLAGALALSCGGVALARGHHQRRHPAGHHAHAHRAFARMERLAPASPGAPSAEPSANAGTVVSFEEGVLTLKLNSGVTVSGTVTSDTEIKCEAPQAMAKVADHGADASESSGDDGSDGASASTPPPPGTETERRSGEDGAGSEDAGQQDDEEAASGPEEAAGGPGGCGVVALTPGAVVREAELRVGSSGSTFKEIELIG